MADDKKEMHVGHDHTTPEVIADLENPPLENPEKSRWERSWPVIACGAGLFSDGYLQSVIGPVNTCLSSIYGAAYDKSSAQQNVTSIAFAGTVLGQLAFGYTSDHFSRKWSLLASTIILFIFAALGAGSWGANGTAPGLFAALTAYRFLLGIGIGGEYPAGSVGCAESTGELKEGHRNRWFIMFTNVQIDLGFILGALMPTIIAAANSNLTVVWRTSLALGVIPPLSLVYLRFKMKEPEAYARNNLKKNMPYWLALKYYGFRLFLVCIIWFIYDFLTYPFSIYSSAWINSIQPNANIWQSFGWSTLVNFFYLPGALVRYPPKHVERRIDTNIR
jgi:MFS family permease